MNPAEKLAAELQVFLDGATPEELVAWLAEFVSMRKETEKKSPAFYRTVFKLAVEKLYLKTLTEKS